MNGVGDTKQVSTQEIEAGIADLRRDFIANLNNDSEDIREVYQKLINNDALRSAPIEGIVDEINAKFRFLTEDFDSMAARLANGMFQSQEDIEAHRAFVESVMSVK